MPLLDLDIADFKIYINCMTKLRLDLTNGILEVEGEEEFVKSVYAEFKDELASQRLTPLEKPYIEVDTPDITMTKPVKKTKRVAKSSSSAESYTLIKDLDFTKGEGGMSLKEFHKQKSPISFAEKNVVFVYYLKNLLKIPKVTLDHIYTCYDEVGSRKPGAFKQSIADTSSKKGWLNTSSFEDITVPIRGQNYVDHDLPAKVSDKK